MVRLHAHVPAGIRLLCMLFLVSAGSRAIPHAGRTPILEYIMRTWETLTRSHRNLAEAAADPKFHAAPDGRWPVYVPHAEDLGRIRDELRREMRPQDFRRVEIRSLPGDVTQVREQGLLYLPHPYVVPGGRFNEMYGWDSYFIQIGLLRDGLVPLAKDLADNFLYEIDNYGKILNANRTYYLTRSQPPFLTQMLLGVYERTHDRQWLQGAVPAIEKYYRYWTSEPHATPATELSRYYDLGEGPAPEVVASELDANGHNDYDLARDYYRTHRVTAYEINQYYDATNNRLTPLFYKGDRSMRESGFDPSERFGPFSVDIIHYNPVCLNSLLYLMEMQTAEILRALDRPEEAVLWQHRGEERAARINRLMWDGRDKLYYDYDFVHQRVRRYPFLTTFYPLWAGISSREQAAGVVSNLKLFERPGGLQTSTNQSGDQWDAPFGWAPLEMIAVEGLRRYGYQAEANKISEEYLSMVAEQYRATGRIVEKYDVARRSAQVVDEIRFGYESNEPGFGWTNAVFTALYDQLPVDRRRGLDPIR